MYHYVVVRADLPRGLQTAQVVHAAGESAGGPLPDGVHAVALAAQDEKHLQGVATKLEAAGIEIKRIVECDGQLMAVGCKPVADRTAIRKALSTLPLVK